MNQKNIDKIIMRLAAAALSLALLPLAACGSQTATTQETPTPAQETPAPAQETQPEMNRDELPSDMLQGVYNELTADYSAYGELKRYYGEFMPDVKYSEELGEDRLTVTLDSSSEYVESGSWSFVDEGDALTTTIANDDYTGMGLVLNVVDAVALYYGMNTGLAVSYVNGLGMLGVNNDAFSETENADGTITFRIGAVGVWDMKELDQMVITEDTLYADPLGEDYVNQTAAVGKIRMYSIGNVDSFAMLFYEYEDLDDVAYQSMVNAVKTLQPRGWESFVQNYTAIESVETDEYTVTVDPDEDTIFQIVDEIDGLYRYVLVQFGEPQNNGDDGFYDYDAEIADSMLSGMWQDEISQRANLDVVMYSDGRYEMTVTWGSGAFETAVWEIRGFFSADENDNAALSYEYGYYSVRTYDEDGNETITQEATTQGSFTLQDDGKLRWLDSQVAENGYNEGCLFVQEG